MKVVVMVGWILWQSVGVGGYHAHSAYETRKACMQGAQAALEVYTKGTDAKITSWDNGMSAYWYSGSTSSSGEVYKFPVTSVVWLKCWPAGYDPRR